MGVTTVLAVSAAVTAAYGIYQGITAPGAPSPQQAGPPGNFITYDSNGNITGEQTWNADKNAYESHTYEFGKEPAKPEAPKEPKPSDYPTWGLGNIPKYDEQGNPIPGSSVSSQYQAAMDKYKTDLEKYNNETLPAYQKQYDEWSAKKTAFETEQANTQKLINDAQAELGVSWDERVKRYDQAATAFAEQQHSQLDPQFAKEQQQVAETMNAKGMTGSRAEVDTNTELGKAKMLADEEIARNATLYKYALGDADFQRSLGTLNALKAGQSSDAAIAMQKQSLGMQGAIMSNQANLASTIANNNSSYQKWLADYMGNAARSKMGTDTASGLAYLYGYGKKSGWGSTSPSWNPAGVTPKSGSMPSTGDYLG